VQEPVAPVCIAFDVSPDRRRASVAIGGRRLDGKLHVELTDAAEGVGWIAPRLKQLVEDHDPYAVVCDATQELLAEQVFQEPAFGLICSTAPSSRRHVGRSWTRSSRARCAISEIRCCWTRSGARRR
jgi:hypothetical protein